MILNFERGYSYEADGVVTKIANKTELKKDPNNENGYILTICQKDNESMPLKIIKFATKEEIKLDDNSQSLIYNASSIMPTELIEYTTTNPDVAFITKINEDEQTVTTKRYERMKD